MKYYETNRLSLRTIEENDFPFLKKYLLKNKNFLSQWEPQREDSFYEDATILQRLEDEIISDSKNHAIQSCIILYI